MGGRTQTRTGRIDHVLQTHFKSGVKGGSGKMRVGTVRHRCAPQQMDQFDSPHDENDRRNNGAHTRLDPGSRQSSCLTEPIQNGRL
jgi:hypothetical protein